MGKAADGATARCPSATWPGRAGPTKGWGSDGAVGSESNEIPAIPALLGVLKLGGTVVTIDTMGCRTARPQPRRLQRGGPQGPPPDGARIGPPLLRRH